jgi:pyruvate kinase
MSATSDLNELRAAISDLVSEALAQEQRLAPEIGRVQPEHLAPARNLAHYLALRQHDLRDLQSSLAAFGLSSLGRSERCVLATLEAVGHALDCLAGTKGESMPARAPTTFETADRMLDERTTALLGPPLQGRASRIMLTLPGDADASAIDALLAEGTDVVRINCAKGNADAWGRMIEWVRAAERRRGRECRVLCDLAGPNPRTLDLSGMERDVMGRVAVGDRLWIAAARPSDDVASGRNAVTLGCTLPSILADLEPNDRVYYDDGKLSGVVREATPGGALVEVTFARKESVKVRPDKGLNFPDTRLSLPSLTAKDIDDLGFIVRHADMVGLSFVRDPADVQALQRELSRLGTEKLGIVLKIETRGAFQSLPRLLLTAMQSPRIGIMVARGDMAIEMGFERLAEAQEEILWLSEAAFVPVIWATQVLDVLNRTGVPSRAEVTDAAMGGRAECVMLNQGKHQVEALRFLRNVLERMEQHQRKKRSMLRKLRISSLG